MNRSFSVACLLVAPALAFTQPPGAVPTLKLTNAACSGATSTLSLDARTGSFRVDAVALKLGARPKELMIMRKPDMTFFTVPWSPKLGGQEVSSATVKSVFAGNTLFPLRKGETLYLNVMSTKDEPMAECRVGVS